LAILLPRFEDHVVCVELLQFDSEPLHRRGTVAEFRIEVILHTLHRTRTLLLSAVEAPLVLGLRRDHVAPVLLLVGGNLLAELHHLLVGLAVDLESCFPEFFGYIAACSLLDSHEHGLEQVELEELEPFLKNNREHLLVVILG